VARPIHENNRFLTPRPSFITRTTFCRPSVGVCTLHPYLTLWHHLPGCWSGGVLLETSKACLRLSRAGIIACKRRIASTAPPCSRHTKERDLRLLGGPLSLESLSPHSWSSRSFGVVLDAFVVGSPAVVTACRAWHAVRAVVAVANRRDQNMRTTLRPLRHIKVTSPLQIPPSTSLPSLRRSIRQAKRATSMKTRCLRCRAGILLHHEGSRIHLNMKIWK
jgi:hypothetical protein